MNDGSGPPTGDEDGSLHQQVWSLIPWVINGRASASEQERVRLHVATCVDCRSEYHFQSQLHEALIDEGDPAEPSAGPGLAVLLARIDEDDPVATSVANRARSRWRGWPLMLAAACLLQAIALVVLVGRLPPDAGAQHDRYDTYSSSALPDRAELRLVADPKITLADLQALLADYELEIVAGPGPGGVLTLTGRAGQDPRQRLDALRADSRVRLAVAAPAGTAP